jgi:membrane protein
MQKIKEFLKLFKNAWTIFVANYPIEFASSFAYFSLFGLPSIFLIIIFILGFAFETPMLYQELGAQLKEILGQPTAELLVLITQNYVEHTIKDIWNTIAYVITIFLLATQLLVFFQDILNKIWHIKPNFKNQFQKHLKERGLTFLMALFTGILFFSSVAIERGIFFLFGEAGNEGGRDFIINVITALFVLLWFTVLYKFLPFVKLPWEPAIVGAVITSILFFIGVWLLLEFVVKEQRLDDLYDYVAPIVLVSFWIFYNSLAFLYGASFTKAYAAYRGKEIMAKSYAFKYAIVKAE